MERHQAERSDAAASSKNPALPLAARAVAEGNFDAAWSALSSAAEEDPDDDEVALAWWRLACDQGRAEEAVKVILSRIRAELRGGDLDTALGYWFDVTHHAPGAQVDARMTIRLAESLLERGERAGAREALRRAVEDTEGLSTALAQRVVRSAQDLDSELAQSAARVALQDAQLDPDSRAALEALIEADAPGPDAAVEVAVEEALPDAIELAEEVLDLDDPIESAANAEELAPQPEHEGPAALGEEALAIELAGLEGEALEENDFAQLGLAEELTDPGGSDDPDGAANVSALDEAELSVAGLLDDRGTDLSDGREQWEDAQEIEPQAPLEPPSDLDPGAVGFEEREEDKAILEGGEESPLEALPTGTQTLRTAKVIEGAPVAVGAEALEVEITGRGLGRIPYSRIEAVAVAAVAGLSVRPVLVVDLVLNWNSRLDEPLKVIRIRGNQFDPLSLVPGAPSPLQALKDVIATISGRSGAESLPSEAALDGTPFHRCEDLAQFEAEILGVEG
jgi:tetratricopeptide (TPR) repeat protein